MIKAYLLAALTILTLGMVVPVYATDDFKKIIRFASENVITYDLVVSFMDDSRYEVQLEAHREPDYDVLVIIFEHWPEILDHRNVELFGDLGVPVEKISKAAGTHIVSADMRSNDQDWALMLVARNELPLSEFSSICGSKYMYRQITKRLFGDQFNAASVLAECRSILE